MKRFILKIILWVFPIWILFILITFYFISIVDDFSGDLGRIGMIRFGKTYSMILKENYPEKNLCDNIESSSSLSRLRCDILTIGDSFSQQGVCGYQNYMANKNLNIKNIKNEDPMNLLYTLLTENMIDSTNTRIIILESVERIIPYRLYSLNKINIEFSKELTNGSDFKSIYKSSPLLYAKNFLLIRLGYKNCVYNCDLNNTLFTHKDGNKLYFYCDDLIDKSIKKEDEHIIKENTNILFKLANKRGIKLVLLIAADKYDIYQEFIINNKYPKKTVNEDLKRIIGNDGIVYSKDILLPHIRKGEKDIYMMDDTHWSYKASKIIADYLVEYIKNKQSE